MAEAALRLSAPAGVVPGARRPSQPGAIQACGGGGCASAELDPDAAVRAASRGGVPLSGPVRAYFEPRFGHDFGQVRVHADAEAADGARAVRARAYTVGEQIVFGAGEYRPDSDDGRRLLAHELAHVVQQGGAAPPAVQRKCGAELGAPAPDCQPSDAGVVGWQLLFRVNCDELLPGQAGRIATLAAGSQLRIHGFASLEGDPAFNLDLSCHRANRVAELVRSTRPDLTIEGVFKHGASPQSSPGSVPDANPPDFWRSVIVEEIKAAPRPPQPTTRCGPDATDWFLDQVAVGKRNARVLAVRQQLDTAAFFAPQIAPLGQLDSMEILEGVVAEKVGAAWRAAGMPRPTAEANAQLGQSQIGQLEATAAKSAALGLDTAAITTLTALRDASLQWKELVGTGKPFDFKNDASTMKAPRSAHCPDPQCPNTITLCAGSRGLNCFVKDMPGNVFYATVGRFVGFGENVLQLGSQFAQLAAGGSWDPPEDTEMIAFGFNLPHPLTRAAFCSALEGAKTSFDLQSCGECQEQPDPAPARIDPH